MRPAPPRLPVLRRPPARVVVAVTLALLSAVVVQRSSGNAAAATARYGTLVHVVVATTALEPGDVVDGRVALVERPAAFVPEGALTEVPHGQVVTTFVGRGEALTARRVGGDEEGVAALVPTGWRAVAVPVWDARPPVAVGDLVDVIVVGDPVAARPVVVVEAALVVDVAEDEEAVTVAVPARDAPALAGAIVAGAVTLALVG